MSVARDGPLWRSVAGQQRKLVAAQKLANGLDRQTGKRRATTNALLNVKRIRKSRNLAPSLSITGAEMADVAPPASERRDKSADSPAKYAGNEDGEKSDDEHRGKIRWSGSNV